MITTSIRKMAGNQDDAPHSPDYAPAAIPFRCWNRRDRRGNLLAA
jgi:hypothetical protein